MVASHLAKRLQDARHTLAAAQWAVHESVRAGRILELPSGPTLSDGTAGGIEADAITFDICRDIITEYVTVSEQDIASAMRAFIDSHHLLLEGAAGVALAGLLSHHRKFAGKNIVVLICGGNMIAEKMMKYSRRLARNL